MGDLKFEVIKKISETNFKVRDLSKISQFESASPPSVFIGSRLEYPLVNVGILSPIEKEKEAWIFDDAKYWAENNFQISDILKLRNNLLNSRFKTKVGDFRVNKNFINISQEIAVSSKPVDIEIQLKNRVRFGRNKDKILSPHGMNSGLKKAKITSNVKINRQLDKLMNDEVKASESIKLLYKNDFSEYSLSKILSVGVLGIKKNKRLVPTRWSLTATDDMLGKFLLKRVKNYKLIEDYKLFFGEFLGNCYLIMLFPDVWSYELVEIYSPKSSWNPSNEIKASTDFENYFGRKTYAFNTAGGYYATRFPILEYLDKIKRQASVLVIRIETPSYWAGLGVWVVRESVKKALKKNMKFNSKKELLDSAKKIGKIKYNFDIKNILEKSKLLKQKKVQKNLRDWI